MDRRDAEAGLSTLVRNNRFTIAVVFPLVGALLFVAGHEGWIPARLARDPLLILFGTLVMRSPLVAGLAPLVDRRAGIALLALAAYTYAVEFVGVTTGFPYGEFRYGVELGPMLFGTVPAGLPVFFFPLVLNSYLLCLLLLGPRAGSRLARFAASLAVVLLVDLVLDPAAVALGLWTYAEGGAYYGVPPSNYAGWLASGAVAVGLVELGFDWRALRERLDRCEFALDDMVSFVVLWGATNAYFANWIPVCIALLLFVGLRRSDRFDFAVLRSSRGAPR
ncbi:bisanhydrobacterioruberin hydratase [Haladaptatus salinisoli]|uniref:bisanhydrobacterioruberin hydratase n=1 Tax=Haladaptatus salinisoli TaxID=2884876 RepID=UPI001D0BA0D3|nr:bisanhydrobacterioruberin hydratase [Haladaptatus salinisoli]